MAASNKDKDELYDIAFKLERFATTGLKDAYVEQLRRLVDRIREVAKNVD